MALDLSPQGLGIISGGGDNRLARTLLTTNKNKPTIKSKSTVPPAVGLVARQPSPSSSWARPTDIETALASTVTDLEEESSTSLIDESCVLLPAKGDLN